VTDTWECSKLYQGKFRLHIRKHFFTKRVVEHCKRLPRDVVNAPSLSVFKRHFDNTLSNVLQFGQPWTGQTFGLDHHCRSLLTEIVYSTKHYYRNNKVLLRYFSMTMFKEECLSSVQWSKNFSSTNYQTQECFSKYMQKGVQRLVSWHIPVLFNFLPDSSIPT